MLKRALFLIAAVSTAGLFCVSSQAAPSSGTDPVKSDGLWALAVEYDYIYDRELKSSDIKDGELKLAKTAYGRLIFKPSKFLNLYGKAGITMMEAEMDMNTGKTIIEEYETGFYGGGGAKVILELGPRLKVCVDNQLNWWECDISDVEYGGATATTMTGDMTSWEYQVSGILSYKIDWQKVIHPIHGEYPALIPYVGAKYAYLEMESDVTASAPGFSVTAPDTRNNDSKFGIICGLDIDFVTLGGFNLNIEARFLDETAISGHICYNF